MYTEVLKFPDWDTKQVLCLALHLHTDEFKASTSKEVGTLAVGLDYLGYNMSYSDYMSGATKASCRTSWVTT